VLIVRVLFAIFALVFCAVALSEPPAPSLAEKSETPDKNAEQHKDMPDSKQFNADRSAVIVNVGPSTYTSPIPKPDTREQNKEPSTDWWIVVPTCLLALFTFGLLCYTAMLWGSCWRRPNIDHPCRLNIDQGWKAVRCAAGCG
jgi:hypothetical protein